MRREGKGGERKGEEGEGRGGEGKGGEGRGGEGRGGEERGVLTVCTCIAGLTFGLMSMSYTRLSQRP